jgi:hypothetical protein
MQTTASIARGDYPLSTLQVFHPADHFDLIWSSIISFVVASGFWLWEEGRRGVRDGNRAGTGGVETIFTGIGSPRTGSGVMTYGPFLFWR